MKNDKKRLIDGKVEKCYHERQDPILYVMYFLLLGASLAQDRGRLEARVEVLGAELETQKKQNERDNDALKIKTRIIDDQTETIRKLKEVVGCFDCFNHYVFLKANQQKSHIIPEPATTSTSIFVHLTVSKSVLSCF